jgi:hypothetical protein
VLLCACLLVLRGTSFNVCIWLLSAPGVIVVLAIAASQELPMNALLAGLKSLLISRSEM